MLIVRWLAVLLLAMLCGKVMTKLKMPAILGWLIAGMLLGPCALALLPQRLMDSAWYNALQDVMQVAVGLMLGTELVWQKIKRYGRALVVTTLTQSLGTFAVVSASFALLFLAEGIPVWLAFAFGGIALATAPAPALSITREFHTKGPVTDTLLPMAVLDDIVGIVVFFTVNSFIARQVSGGAMGLGMIPVMIFLPILIGLVTGYPTGLLIGRMRTKASRLSLLLGMILLTGAAGWMCGRYLVPGIDLNYMLMGVSFSAVFSNMIHEQQLEELVTDYDPILSFCLLVVIVNLGAPLDYHLILGAGLYTVLYIVSRAAGKYFGARAGARATHLPDTVQKYLGLTLLPHSGVSLVFTGIICDTLAGQSRLAQVVKGTIAAAAIINEIIAVFAARKGFVLAGEIEEEKKEEKNPCIHGEVSL